LRDTDGSTTATALVGSRPSVDSPAGNGIVESVKGPAVTSSLGSNQCPPLRVVELLITERAEMHAPLHPFLISERITRLSNRIVPASLGAVTFEPHPDMTPGVSKDK
jgi:hypothetical protein